MVIAKSGWISEEEKISIDWKVPVVDCNNKIKCTVVL